MISDSAVAPLKFQFLGFPTVSGVCGVAFSKECGKRFLLFRFKSYCCSNQNPTIRTDTFNHKETGLPCQMVKILLRQKHRYFQPVVSNGIAFLVSLYKSGLVYSAVKTARSTLSSILVLKDLGRHN